MPFNTFTIGTAVTPTVIETYVSHYLDRKDLHGKPTAHITYHEGIRLIRKFLDYSAHHTVEEIQTFTAQWIPHPQWVKVDVIKIPAAQITEAAEAIQAQLGPKGVQAVGGKSWWQWRRPGTELKAEWIEMRRDYSERKKEDAHSNRVMLYVHGGAYFFGSVGLHRYQMQRHARKLKARVFAPEYRLAPQFPFPCGLHDCLSAYMYLLTIQDPSTIILAGDSAGGGMVVSMLVTLRDQGIPLPAGAILVSPWVDLTHSFPSVAGESKLDYIPPHGFMQRPSASWPPPNADDMQAIAKHAVENLIQAEKKGVASQKDIKKEQEAKLSQDEQDAVHGFSVDSRPTNVDALSNENNPTGTEGGGTRPGNTIPGQDHDLSIMIDGEMITIKDQIQMYATNQLISHPLVSPVLQPSLGGLPPLLILTGGGEMLRDEQIYLAHKAANPAAYPPGEAYLNEYPEARELIEKYKPTDVQLQVWDDLCHVAPTLSFTRPAKYMYRSIAQFGAWALARAQKAEIDILDDDDVSVIGSDSDSESTSDEASGDKQPSRRADSISIARVGKAGDALPAFHNHLVRQRVDRHGNIYPLGPHSSLPALQMSPNEIGVIKPGPVRKWMAAKKMWDTKFARQKRAVQKQRANEMAKGYETFANDEVPPPSALAGRRKRDTTKEEKPRRSYGLALWAMWGSRHDKDTIEREEKADRNPEIAVIAPNNADSHTSTAAITSTTHLAPPFVSAKSRSRSRRRTVTDAGQADENTPAGALVGSRDAAATPVIGSALANTDATSGAQQASRPATASTAGTGTGTGTAIGDAGVGSYAHLGPIEKPDRTRPTAGNVAYPFKLAHPLSGEEANPSTLTLSNVPGISEKRDVVESRGLSPPASRAGMGMGGVGQEAGLEAGQGTGQGTGEQEAEGEKERPRPERFVTATEL
ncbi:MAG: hypothetical protein M1819_003333 [Sarea resinae]|nr:MAG: hypothetical protein M1819_003333 [Sarea resinae]